MKFKTISLVCSILLILAGCATPARVEQMTARPSTQVIRAADSSLLRSNTAVKSVTGGKATNPLWVSNVSGSDFERALEASLSTAGLLASNRQASLYQINADLVKMDQPIFGIDMTVTAQVKYELVERSTGKTIYSKEIRSPFTATMGDAFLGSERLKIANEGAVKSNLNIFISEIISLSLKKNNISE